jgi:hypothetical protein
MIDSAKPRIQRSAATPIDRIVVELEPKNSGSSSQSRRRSLATNADPTTIDPRV